MDLSKVAEEQRLRLQEERERMEAALKAKGEADLLEDDQASSTHGAEPAVTDGRGASGEGQGDKSNTSAKDGKPGSRNKEEASGSASECSRSDVSNTSSSNASQASRSAGESKEHTKLTNGNKGGTATSMGQRSSLKPKGQSNSCSSSSDRKSVV